MLSRLIVAVVTACLLAACATPTTHLVNQAAKSGTQTEAFPKLLALANQGDAEAQWAVGYYYVKGSGIDQDYDKAFEWLTKSAKGGHHGGMNWLAQCYLNGWGTPKNPKEAIYWYEKAAAKGNSGALKTLGDAYFYGYHYQKNYPQALNYYLQALARGSKEALSSIEKMAQTDIGAQRELGGAYYYGKGVSRNYSTAYRYFNQCAGRNDGACFFFLGKILQTGGDGVEQDQNKAKFAFQKGSALGNQQARAALDSINSADNFAEGLGQALLIGLVIFGAAAAAKSGAYSDYSSSPDVSAILQRPQAAEVRPYASSGGSAGTGTVVPTRKVEQDIEAVNPYTREKYKGTVDSFGNVDLHPQYDPGTKYKGTVDSDGTGRVKSWSGDELTIKPR